MDLKTQLTTGVGIPVGDNQNSWIAGAHGPGLLSAWHLFIAKDGENYGRK
jgi:catalase